MRYMSRSVGAGQHGGGGVRRPRGSVPHRPADDAGQDGGASAHDVLLFPREVQAATSEADAKLTAQCQPVSAVQIQGKNDA